jgi:hypothetical protein
MYYIIKSARLGELGTEYEPKPGINVDALLWGGLIVEVNPESPTKYPHPHQKKVLKIRKQRKRVKHHGYQHLPFQPSRNR